MAQQLQQQPVSWAGLMLADEVPSSPTYAVADTAEYISLTPPPKVILPRNMEYKAPPKVVCDPGKMSKFTPVDAFQSNLPGPQLPQEQLPQEQLQPDVLSFLEGFVSQSDRRKGSMLLKNYPGVISILLHWLMTQEVEFDYERVKNVLDGLDIRWGHESIKAPCRKREAQREQLLKDVQTQLEQLVQQQLQLTDAHQQELRVMQLDFEQKLKAAKKLLQAAQKLLQAENLKQTFTEYNNAQQLEAAQLDFQQQLKDAHQQLKDVQQELSSLQRYSQQRDSQQELENLQRHSQQELENLQRHSQKELENLQLHFQQLVRDGLTAQSQRYVVLQETNHRLNNTQKQLDQQLQDVRQEFEQKPKDAQQQVQHRSPKKMPVESEDNEDKGDDDADDVLPSQANDQVLDDNAVPLGYKEITQKNQMQLPEQKLVELGWRKYTQRRPDGPIATIWCCPGGCANKYDQVGHYRFRSLKSAKRHSENCQAGPKQALVQNPSKPTQVDVEGDNHTYRPRLWKIISKEDLPVILPKLSGALLPLITNGWQISIKFRDNNDNRYDLKFVCPTKNCTADSVRHGIRTMEQANSHQCCTQAGQKQKRTEDKSSPVQTVAKKRTFEDD